MSFMEFIGGLINTVMAAAIPVLVGAFVQYVRIRTRSEKANQYIEIVESAIKLAVAETSQTFVDLLKTEGGFTAEQGKAAKEMAIGRVKQIAGETALVVLGSVFGDAQAYIEAGIEKAVRENK